MTYIRWGGVLLATCLNVSLVTAAEVTAESDPIQAEFTAAFDAMLENPADVDAVVRYSLAAAHAGDYESAIGALERLLLMNSNQPVLRADLGLFYFYLESYEAAKYHLTKAIADESKIPTSLARTVKQTLGKIDNKLARSSFSGGVRVGMSYQTNMNAGADSATVLAAGVPVALPNSFREENDIQTNLFGHLRHQYDLQNKYDAVIDTHAFAYITRHADLSRLNVVNLQLSPGIRFKPSPTDIKGLSLRPHLIGDYFTFDGDHYYTGYGLGLDADYRIRTDLSVSGSIKSRYLDYNQTTKRPSLDGRDGLHTSARLGLSKVLTRNMIAQVTLNGTRRNARQDFNAADVLGVQGRMILSHASLFGSDQSRWRTNFDLSYTSTNYDSPDPVVDPTRSRDERQWKVAVGTVIPIATHWDLNLGLSHSKVNSNIRNFDRDNTSLDVNANWRF